MPEKVARGARCNQSTLDADGVMGTWLFVTLERVRTSSGARVSESFYRDVMRDRERATDAV